MQPLSTQSLLAAWELGWGQPHVIQRSLTLLAAAHPDFAREELAQLSVGERDRLLLDLREQIFGSRMHALAICPHCGQRSELQFEVREVKVGDPLTATEGISVRVDDYQITFRLPNSLDMAAIAQMTSADAAKQQLMERIVLRAVHRDQDVPVAQLPERVGALVEEEMGKNDPQSEVQLSLHCESCGKSWLDLFDIVPFLWREVDAWAVRLLREVHSLARAYGWSESDILAMTSWRRHCYLEMLSE